MSFLAMPVDEHVATVLSAPDSSDELGIPTLLDDYRNAKANGTLLWVVVEITGSEPNFEFKSTAITREEFLSTYRIDERPEFPNDWYDVSKI